MINASNGGICVEFWRKKQHNLGLPTFKLPTSTKNLWRLTLYYYFWRFQYMNIRTEFSCLYPPQGHNFISTVWPWSTDEYCAFWDATEIPGQRILDHIFKFLILSESPSLIYICYRAVFGLTNTTSFCQRVFSSSIMISDYHFT